MSGTAHTVALEKQSRAIGLLHAGRSYEQIADELEYANRGSAWKAVDRGLRAQRDELAREYLDLAIERLEALLAAHWAAATREANVESAHVVLRALAHLDQLLGLVERARRNGSKPRTPVARGVVLSPDELAALDPAARAQA